MKNSEIRKAVKQQAEREVPKVIKDQARGEAYRRVQEAMAEEHQNDPAREEEGAGATETARKTGTKVIPGHAIEGHLGHGER